MNLELRLAEAILFASAEPVTERELTERLPEGADVPALLSALTAYYQDRGIGIVRIAGGWTFRTAEDLASHLRLQKRVMRKPSRAAVETLAVIAYHQPITRSEVEEIRGVAASRGTFDALLEAEWIRPIGRRSGPGRPMTWGTTRGFLEHFGLASLADLPDIDELKAAGLIDTRPASVVAGIVQEVDEGLDTSVQQDDDSQESLPLPLAVAEVVSDGGVIEREMGPSRLVETGPDFAQHP